MSRYTPVGPTPSYPPRPPALHRTSSSLASHPSRQHEMEAAFDDSDEDEDDDDENRPLSQARGGRGLVWDAGDDAGLPDEDARAATNGVSASSSATSPPPADGVDDPLRRPIALRPATTLQPTDAEPTYDFDRDYASGWPCASMALAGELMRAPSPWHLHRSPVPSAARLTAARGLSRELCSDRADSADDDAGLPVCPFGALALHPLAPADPLHSLGRPFAPRVRWRFRQPDGQT